MEPPGDQAADLPPGLVHVRTTPVFDTTTVPAGLLRAHEVAAGVWGRLAVRTGTLVFVFEDTPHEPIALGPGEAIAIPPGRPHHVELPSPATFVVEFHRAADDARAAAGRESSGLPEPD